MRPDPEATWLPDWTDLDGAPELAALAILRAALDVADAALYSASPELAADPPHPDYPELRATRRVLVDTAHLRRAIAQYRDATAARLARAAARGDDDSDDIPF